MEQVPTNMPFFIPFSDWSWYKKPLLGRVVGGGSWCQLALKSSFLHSYVGQTDHCREQKQRRHNCGVVICAPFDYIERHSTFRC